MGRRPQDSQSSDCAEADFSGAAGFKFLEQVVPGAGGNFSRVFEEIFFVERFAQIDQRTKLGDGIRSHSAERDGGRIGIAGFVGIVEFDRPFPDGAPLIPSPQIGLAFPEQ